MAPKQAKPDTSSGRLRKAWLALMEDIRQIIAEARRNVAATVNAGLTMLYRRVSKRVVNESSWQ